MQDYFDYLRILKANPEIDKWILEGSKICQEMSVNSEELEGGEHPQDFFSGQEFENEELQRKNYELKGKLEDTKADLRTEKSKNKDLRTLMT